MKVKVTVGRMVTEEEVDAEEFSVTELLDGALGLGRVEIENVYIKPAAWARVAVFFRYGRGTQAAAGGVATIEVLDAE